MAWSPGINLESSGDLPIAGNECCGSAGALHPAAQHRLCPSRSREPARTLALLDLATYHCRRRRSTRLHTRARNPADGISFQASWMPELGRGFRTSIELEGFTLRKGFESQLSSPLLALPQVCCVVASQECRGLPNGSWVPRTAWLAAAAACLPTRERWLQLCGCPNKRRAAHRKSLMQQCAS